jgi:hypothetical protein
MSDHRRYFLDHALLYVFSIDIELGLDIEEIGVVPEGARVNLHCVPGSTRAYNIIRERTAAAPGYSAVTGTIVWGEDVGVVREDDVAVPAVRACIRTDDGALIETTYRGNLSLGMGGFRAIVAGADAVGTPDSPVEFHLISTPAYCTADPRYQWLAEYQCVGFGRSFEIDGLFRRVTYDIYAMT